MTLMTQAEFAKATNLTPGRISQLKAAGRLVFDEAGKLVDYEQSLELIEATADPSRAGVAERHELNRESPPAAPAPMQTGEAAAKVKTALQVQSLRKRTAEANTANLEAAELAGELARVDDMAFVLKDLAAISRVQWENLEDQLAPLLIGKKTLEDIRAVIADHAARNLETLEALFKERGKKYREMQ